MLTYVELFAGAGGLSRGLEAAGFEAKAHAEIEPHACAVLRYRWPGVRLDGDVTQINGADFAGVTLVSGGSPCQDLSVAGKRAGLDGARSGLFHHQVRIWQESGAPYLLWENVYGALSSNHGRDFATVLSTLVGAPIAVPADGWRRGGVAAGRDAVAAWRVSDLQHFGPPQRRVRVFILAARTGGVDPAEVLALREGVCGHPAPREQSRQGTARGAQGGARGGGTIPIGEVRARQGKPHGSSVMVGQPGDPMFSLTSKQHGVMAWDDQLNAGSETHGPLMARAKSGGDRNGVIAYDDRNQAASTDAHHTLRADGIGGRVADAVIAFDNRPETYANNMVNTGTAQGTGNPLSVICTTGEVTHALTHEGADASEDGTGRGTPIVMASWQANAEIVHDGSPSLTALHEAPIAVVGTLDVHDSQKWGSHQWMAQNKAMVSAGRPRRLTPRECERLMSWPDDWTATGQRGDGTVYALSDTARYRLCGNGVGSVQVQWIAERLAAAIREQQGC